jgi:hypothetical protein
MSSTKPIAYLFPQTSRAQTPDAPPYDNARKVKSWKDPNPGPGPNVTYQMLDPMGNIISVTIPITEASTLNLPGHPDYPVYAPTKSTATFALSGVPISGTFGVATLSDAQALAKTFGLTDAALFDELAVFQAGAAISWPANDPRRAYGIRYANGAMEEVARLLAQQNANGVGSPGEWKQDAAGNWFWKSELASDPVNPEIMPVPIVPLAANEHIQMGPFGPVTVVDDPTPAPSTGGGIDLSIDPTAQKILEGVNAIRGLLHV